MSVPKVADGHRLRAVGGSAESNISAAKKESPHADLRQRLREMLEVAEWGAFFRRCCEASAFRLRSQVRQFGEGLHARDLSADAPRREDLEDALLDLARERYPDELGGQWDALHAAEMAAVAMRYLADNYPEAEGSAELDPHHHAVHEAAVREDHAGHRAALREYAREGRRVALAKRSAEALEEHETEEGAA